MTRLTLRTIITFITLNALIVIAYIGLHQFRTGIGNKQVEIYIFHYINMYLGMKDLLNYNKN